MQSFSTRIKVGLETANPIRIPAIERDFGGTSVLQLIDKYDNLIVVQTFSKSRSMAGMRIGFAVSNPTLIRVLNDCKFSFNSYTMNQTTIAAGVAAVSDRAYLEETLAKIVQPENTPRKFWQKWASSSQILRAISCL